MARQISRVGSGERLTRGEGSATPGGQAGRARARGGGGAGVRASPAGVGARGLLF